MDMEFHSYLLYKYSIFGCLFEQKELLALSLSSLYYRDDDEVFGQRKEDLMHELFGRVLSKERGKHGMGRISCGNVGIVFGMLLKRFLFGQPTGQRKRFLLGAFLLGGFLLGQIDMHVHTGLKDWKQFVFYV